MIAYWILRASGRLALRWYYRDLEVVGIERIPEHGAALLASNHPNALVDALIIACTLRRPVLLTAKATLLDHAVTRALVRATGVVPLRRASDAAQPSSASLDPGRNDDAFNAVVNALELGGLILMFPEGKSHSGPALAPLKTGLARIALIARHERGLRRVPIIPVGLTFERKWEPRSRVLMRVGTPIICDEAATAPNEVAALTHQLDAGLRAVTLNFRTSDEAHRVLTVSNTLAQVLDEFRPLGAPDPPLIDSVLLAHRFSELVPGLSTVEQPLGARIKAFLERLERFEQATHAMGIAANDVAMSRAIASGIRFAVRETLIAIVAGPLALWGRLNHWIPLRIARAVAVRTSRTPDEPAMNMMVAGFVSVLAFYVIQISVVTQWLGGLAAALYSVSLPLSASWDFRYADRVRRGIARVRTYVHFRRAPAIQDGLLSELTWLRAEATALDALLRQALVPSTIPLGGVAAVSSGA